MRFGTYYRYSLIKKLKLYEYIHSSDTWLDLGCYDGVVLRAFNAHQKLGIDLEPKKQQDIHLMRASVERLPFKEGSLRVITAFDVLEHIKNDKVVIEQVENKLMKGGLFILSVPHENERIFPKFLKNWLIFNKWKHIRVGYTPASLQKLFKEKWKLKIIYWNTDLSNLLYFPLQFLWRIIQKLTKLILNKLIDIEFIRTKKYSSSPGHIIVMANKR